MSSRKKKTPYSDKTDLEKIKSNWKKIKGLINREEWSSAVVRAATAAEIATNLVIRYELQVNRNNEDSFVNSLLLSANGIQGKYQKLVLPATVDKHFHNKFKKLQKNIGTLNKERNSVAHQGQFKKKTTAIKMVSEARHIVNTFVSEYHEGYEIEEIKST